jgi:hypothetical protein
MNINIGGRLFWVSTESDLLVLCLRHRLYAA